jgi:tetratricopeptide (TPR) repeat protein
MFCLKSFVSFGQEIANEKLLNAIQSNISAGYLTKASEESDKLNRQNPNPSSFYNKMSRLLSARISCLAGDYRKMHELLKTVDRNDNDPVIQYYWKDYFSRYCLENDQFSMGVNALQESIELANDIRSNLRVDMQKNFSELFIIYYTENVERKLNEGRGIPDRIEEIFDYLDKNKHRMEPFEKHFLYSYRLFFTDPHDTVAMYSISAANVAFGNNYDQPVSVIIDKINLSIYDGKTNVLIAEKYLLEAEEKSRNVERLLYRLMPLYKLMVHYKKYGQYEEAVKWGRKARFPKGTDFSTYLDVYGQLSQCFEELGEVDSALKWMKVDNRKFREISRSHDVDMQEFYIDQQKIVIKEKNQAIVIIRWALDLLICASLIFLFLWRKNKRINKELFRKNQSLEHSLETLKNFSHILSHDLRAPIYSIRNLTENILEEDERIPEDSKESLELIYVRVIL